MSRELDCPGPPAHKWNYTPTGPGRPSKYCPEHKPAEKAKPTTRKTTVEKLPTLVESDNPFIRKQQQRETEQRKQEMTQVRAAKRRRAEESAQLEQETMEAEYLEIDERIEASKEAYTKAFDAAKDATYESGDGDQEAAFNKLWHRADVAQSNFINVLNRKRKLEKIIEEATAPAITQETPSLTERAVERESSIIPERAASVESSSRSERAEENESPYGDERNNEEIFAGWDTMDGDDETTDEDEILATFSLLED